MSKMADFYAKVISEETLRGQLTSILAGKDITEASDAELEKIGEIAKAAGFEVTLAEAKEYIASDAKDLSDDALEAVAGGINKGKTECTGKGAGTMETIEIKK